MIFDLISGGADRGDRRGAEMFQRLGRGLGAMANLLTVKAGAPSATLPKELADPWGSRHARESSRPSSDNYLATARSRLDATLSSLKARREERESQARLREMERDAQRRHTEAERRGKLNEKRIEQIDSNIEATRERTRRMAATPARVTGRNRAASAAGSGTFTWVHPETGERYSISKPVWEKSAHTLFQIVVDETRPEPDARGYPTAEQWRRHCAGAYAGKDRRENFIITNLPGSKRGLDYLKKLKR